MTSIEERLHALEQQVQQLRDERDIHRLIASYGPLVDAGEADEVAQIWTEDGVYDVDEVYLAGHRQLAAMVKSSAHQTWIHGGSAHFLGPVHVTVDGDEAIAVGYSLMVVMKDGRFQLRRAGVSHWALRRTEAGWRTTVRTTRVLDGRAESHALLVAGVHAEPAVVDPEIVRTTMEARPRDK